MDAPPWTHTGSDRRCRVLALAQAQEWNAGGHGFEWVRVGEWEQFVACLGVVEGSQGAHIKCS